MKKVRAFHLSMKSIVEDANLDIVFTIGKFMKSLNQVLSSKIEKYHYENISELEEEVKQKVKSGRLYHGKRFPFSSTFYLS